MSDRKKENLFANLGQLAARNADADTAAPVAADFSDAATSPPTREIVKPKPAPSKRTSEPVSGKRQHPDYCQANAYILKSIRKATEKQLLDMDGMDYSTLVEELLRKWLKARGVSE